jgi:hypothetical protein
VTLTTLRPCYLCKRDFEHDGTYRLLAWYDGRVVGICDDCWEKGDVEETLDMTEDDDD